MRNITREEFLDLFRRMRHGAFRLELRDHYNVPAERERWEAFQEADWARLDALNRVQRAAWMELMRSVAAAGRSVERVRVVTEPPTDYVRFELRSNSGNAEAGEDIRYLARDLAAGLDLPADDYWMFDSRQVAIMRFGGDDVLKAIGLVDDPDIVAHYVAGRHAVWSRAVPYEEYVRRWPVGAEHSSGA
ncbi:DUF6879 family protein [Sinosporangium siamense]|uniref:DUF6879 domain-containing protein n=1 Tax=Sinosporangium siamense TaxID=1367973 RepID=A0A919RCV0_9ACTN|nr:DUF6879 family protein [Sinosporangium siamense]GII90119.1 hypothetical protein Ssi02_03500 [Sinosporangium siamense]